MPTYEYACQSCGSHIEVHQRFSDEPLTKCGVCRGPLRKVFHPAGILFKGSGFYATDSRAAARKASSDGGSGDKAASGTTTSKDGAESSGAKKESKTAGSKEGQAPSGSAAESKEKSA